MSNPHLHIYTLCTACTTNSTKHKIQNTERLSLEIQQHKVQLTKTLRKMVEPQELLPEHCKRQAGHTIINQKQKQFT